MNPGSLNESELLLVANMLEFQRSLYSHRGMNGGSTRDIDGECHYPDVNTLTAIDYKDMYDKFGIAERVVNILPDETWGVNPEVYDEEKENIETPFEKAWKELNRGMDNSMFADEESSPVWEVLKRVDQMSGIGRFGVVLLGLGIEGDLSQPLPGFKDEDLQNLYGYTFNEAKVPKKKTELLYLRPLDESLVDVSVYESRRNNRRYGLPVEYNLTLSDPLISHEGIGHDAGREVRVHWSRVIHVADNLSSSEIYGKPRQQSVFHNLLDLRKLYGGSAEMYWQGAFPGLSFETHPQLGNTIKMDAAAMKEQVQKYFDGLQRYLAMTGASAKTLSPQVVDPTSQIERHLDAICIKIGTPKRIFVGSERGELASSQDADSWDNRLKRRRLTYVNPRIIKPLIDRLIQAGVLPKPKNGQYHIKWNDNRQPSPGERAVIAGQRMAAVSAYIQAGADVLIPPQTFLVKELDYDREEAEAILAEAAEIEEEKAVEEEEAQAKAMEQMAQMQPPQGGPQGGPPVKGQPPKGPVPPQLQKAGGKAPTVNSDGIGEPTGLGLTFQPTVNSDGVWRTTATGQRIFIKDGEARVGGPKGNIIGQKEFKYDKGHWVTGEDPRGLTEDHIAYDPPTTWVQEHESLVKDAVQSWVADTSFMGIHIQDELDSAKIGGSGTAKIGRAQAKALLQEVIHNGVDAPTLYRGDNKDPKDNSSPLLGWTSDKKVAQKWAKKRGGQVFTLKGAKGISLNDVPGVKNVTAYEKEWIVPHNIPKDYTINSIDPTANAFCPTGPGGKKDNSCSPANKGTKKLASAAHVLSLVEAIEQNQRLASKGDEDAQETVDQAFNEIEKLEPKAKTLAYGLMEEHSRDLYKAWKDVPDSDLVWDHDMDGADEEDSPKKDNVSDEYLDGGYDHKLVESVVSSASIAVEAVNDGDETAPPYMDSHFQDIEDMPPKAKQFALDMMEEDPPTAEAYKKWKASKEPLSDSDTKKIDKLIYEAKDNMLASYIGGDTAHVVLKKFDEINALPPQAKAYAIEKMKESNLIKDFEDHIGDKTKDTPWNPKAKVEFPKDVNHLKVLNTLGGSTGAKLVEDENGNKFVLKKGNSPGHLRNEYAVESIYRRMGVAVPDTMLYETPDGPVKLAKYLEGASTLGSLPKAEFDVAVKKLQEDFALDATLANWDVAGASLDNVLVSPDGTVYRIDVAGSLNYRAQGALKGSQWNEANSELDSLRNNPKNPSSVKIFGGMTDAEVAGSITKMLNNKSVLQEAMLDNTDASDMFMVNARVKSAEAKLQTLTATPVATASSKSSVTGTTAQDLTKMAAGHGYKAPKNFEEKLAFLNPHGIQGNTLFVPMTAGPAKSWKSHNKEALDALKKSLPSDVELVGVTVQKVFKGDVDYKIPFKEEVAAYNAILKGLGSPELKAELPKGAKDFVASGATKPAPNFPAQTINAGYSSYPITPFHEEEKYQKSWKKLNSSELSVVKDWTGGGYTAIRQAVVKMHKGEQPTTPYDAKKFESAKTLLGALDKIPAFQGVVHRGLTGSDWTQGEIKKIKEAGIGGIWSDDAPHSMSRKMSGYAMDHATIGKGLLLTIKTKSGRPIEGISGITSELEVLGMPKTPYKIVGIHENPTITKASGYGSDHPSIHVELEEL